MVTVKLFGLPQVSAGKAQLEVMPGTVRFALRQVKMQAPGIDTKELRGAVIFINGAEKRGAIRLFLRLRDGDELVVLSPICGG